MNRNNQWLVASDIDGTLLNQKGTIPKRNIDAINHFVDSGHLFTIATGRSVNAIRHIINQITYNAPIILLNGAAIYDFKKEQYIWQNYLAESSKDLVQTVIQHFPTIGVEVYIGTRVIVPIMTPRVLQQMKYEHLPYEEKNFNEISNDLWLKVIFVGTELELNKVVEYINQLQYFETEFVRSENCFYEMLPKNCTKGSALQELAKLCNININHTAAIGDYYNDIELLKAAGFSAAAGQAPEEIIKLVDLKTCHCNEGSVADLLEYILNHKL